MRSRSEKRIALSPYREAALAPRWVAQFFQRLFFALTCLASAVILGLVLLAPLAEPAAEGVDDWGRLLRVFAEDTTVRRTAFATALGLLVTACVFFRHPLGVTRNARPRLPPPRKDVVL